MNYKKMVVLLFLTVVIIFPLKVNGLEQQYPKNQSAIYETNLNNFVEIATEPYEFKESEWDICTKPESLKTFRFIGNILRVIFIVIPILLIVMGSIDFMRAVMAGKEDDIKKAQMTFVKRALAAVIVFLVPLITGVVLNVVGVSKDNCLTCVLNPNSCNVP